MKTENKCFFSISLENGVIITGENPYKVRDFLRRIHIATIYACDNEEMKPTTKRATREIESLVLSAIVTINDNIEY